MEKNKTNIYVHITFVIWKKILLTINTIKGKKKINVLNQTEILEGASLAAQWLGIRLPMQGRQVPALVREDPTCRGATKPVCHNYGDCALEPASHSY